MWLNQNASNFATHLQVKMNKKRDWERAMETGTGRYHLLLLFKGVFCFKATDFNSRAIGGGGIES